MKLKLDANGHVVVENGMPVYVHDDGKEIPFDATAATRKIAELNGEARTHREAKETAEKTLAKFAGIEDPAKALEALKTVKNLDDKKLVEAGEVEKVKEEVNKAWQPKLDAAQQTIDTLTAQLHGEKIGGSFARSKFISDKLAIPADMVQSFFGKNFKLEDGNVKAYGADGNAIFSRVKPGNAADFDEALEILVEQYPNKAAILKADQRPGNGAQNNGQPGAKTLTRAQFDAKNPAEKMAFVNEGGTVSD